MNMKSQPPLFKHQAQTKKRLKTSPAFFDQSEPGTGKTRVQIEDFAERRRKGGGPALVLATRSTLESAWADDFAKFAPDIKVEVAYANNREKAFAREADVYITNHDTSNWLVKQNKQFWKTFKGGTIIIDESTAMKHHTAQRSRNLAKFIKHFDWRRNICGLADPNGVLDLWHQYFLLDGGARLGKSYFSFKAAVCTTEKVQINDEKSVTKWTEKPGISNIVAALVKDITIRHLLNECLDMPVNVEYPRAFTLNPKHNVHYQELQDDMITVAHGKRLSAKNKAILRVKLLQMASGAVYNSDDKEYTAVSSERYEMVLDLVEEVEHSVVFFQWQHQRDELCKEAEKRGVTFAVYDGSTKDSDRAEITKLYQQGAYRTIFAHPKSAAHGLTWVRGTRTIWASPTDNLEWFVQGNRRINRIGQKQRTETLTVLAKGTYDEIAYERLTGKALRSDEFSKRLKEYLL